MVNQDPRRGVGHEKVMTRIELDAQADMMLARQGLAVDSVPAAGQTVLLRSHRQSFHRRHRHRRDRRHPPRQPRHGGARHHAPSAWTSAASISCAPTSAESYKDAKSAAGICESQCRAGFSHARGAERRHAARRRRPGDRHAVPAGRADRACRLPPSPAPTARPPPAACWRTSARWPATRRA